jgi:hypothetical protein
VPATLYSLDAKAQTVARLLCEQPAAARARLIAALEGSTKPEPQRGLDRLIAAYARKFTEEAPPDGTHPAH